MARGCTCWHFTKLSLSSALLSFSGMCILLLFLSFAVFCFVFVVFFCSHWSLVDVPLIFFCLADHVPDWQPRILLSMAEARSVNVKKTTKEGLGAFWLQGRLTLKCAIITVVQYYCLENREKEGIFPDSYSLTEYEVQMEKKKK